MTNGGGQNPFIDLLDLLNVKHTREFSNRYFNEHPHKYNLFGLSKMLTDYGIENTGLKFSDKEQSILEIETPFIAHFGGDFVAVHKVEPDKVYFLWKGAEHDLTIPKFIEAWTGVALVAEPSEKAIEPEYDEHRKSENLSFLKKAALISTSFLILILLYINNSVIQLLSYSIILLLNLSGLYISWLLILKQLNLSSQYADKICSLFKQRDCNSVLESKAAKIFGIFSWSEIGLAYFSVNVLLLLILPQTAVLLALINILCLPYSFWSVGYQLKKKQWCALCLIVQVLLWALFVANLLFGYIQIPVFDFQAALYLVLIGSCYFAAVLGINAMAPKLNSEKSYLKVLQALNALKTDEDVFAAILKKQPYYETKESDSMICFGNPKSSLKITVLTNPYCNPCSMMHKRIEQLMQKMNNNIRVQYILSSFSEELNSTNKLLIAACLVNRTGIEQIFTEWFEKGKAFRDDYFKDMFLNVEYPEIENEFQKHEEWRKKTQIRATPTILVNGFQLPDSYKIEDLRYLGN